MNDIYAKNEIIDIRKDLEEALSKFVSSITKDSDYNEKLLDELLENIFYALSVNLPVFLPVEEVTIVSQGKNLSGEEIDETGLYLPIRKICTEDTGEELAIPVCTDFDMFQLGPAKTDSFSMGLLDFMKSARELKDVEGIVMNPWESPYFISIEDLNGVFAEMIDLIEENGLNAEKGIRVCMGDITGLEVDAIVNAANNTLLGGGGVDGAIHKSAGPRLLEECKKLRGCKTGEAKITKGYDLPAKHVIHTVGPIYSNSKNDPIDLANCYKNSLELARKHDLHTIAFPCISTGVFGYPKKEAAEIAVKTVISWMEENIEYPICVDFCCFNESDRNIYDEILEGCEKLS